MAIYYDNAAMEDLRSIGRAEVIAEIMQIVEDEIRIPPGVVGSDVSKIEGYWRGRRDMMWRRAVRFDDLANYLSFEADDSDEFTCMAYNYVVVYHRPTPTWIVRYRLETESVTIQNVVQGVLIPRHYIDTETTRSTSGQRSQ